MVCPIFREGQRSWPEPRQDDVKQEITIIPQCSYTGFLVYLAVDGEPLTVDPFYLNEELCYGEVNNGVCP